MNQERQTWTRSGPSAGACALALALVGSAAVMPGCRGDRSDEPPRQFFPNMDDGPRWNPQASSQFFPDGRTMRPPVEGAVAYARWAYNDQRMVADAPGAQRKDLLREDAAFYKGRRGPEQFVETVPVPVTADLVLRGQERFNIYCAPCHGYSGDGQGMVGVRWSTPVPSFHAPEVNDPQAADGRGTDGYIFYTAMNGVPRPDGTPSMPSYGHALSAGDAWAVVAYIRVLQESHKGTVEDVPPERRRQLMEERIRLLSAPQPSAPGRAGQTPPPSPQAPEPGTPSMTPPAGGESSAPQSQPQMPRPNP